jgi:hypothetical protein
MEDGKTKENRLIEILEGWKNVIFTDPEVEKIAKARAEICAECEFNVNNVCSSAVQGEVEADFFYKKHNKEYKKGDIVSGCKCPLIAKTRSMQSQCPRNKWSK